MMKRFMTLLMLVALMLMLCLPALAEWDEDIVLDACESNRWVGTHPASLCTSDKQQGKASVEWKLPAGADSFVMQSSFGPIHADGANTLVMDLYISSVSTFYSNSSCSFEMTSSGECDVAETSWNIAEYDLYDGWNHLELAIPKDGGCDLTAINFMRFYTLTMTVDEPLVVRLDNIYLTWNEPEDNSIDTSGDTIGTPNRDKAQPVMKDIEVGTPFDPWGVASGETSDDTPEETGCGSAIGGVGLIVIVLAMVAALAILLRKNTKLTAMLCLAAMLLTGCVSQVPPVTETPSSLHPFFTTDQTGHPENSADEVDVEALLKVDPNYSTKEDYKIHYVSGQVIKDFSTLPHVTMHENASAEKGLSVVTANGKQPEFLHLKDRDCWLMQYWDETDAFYIKADEATTAAYNGTTLTINFVIYLTQDLTMQVKYMDTSGKECMVNCPFDVRKEWVTLTVTLENVALGGKMEGGADISILCGGAEMTRLHAVYFDKAEEKTKPQTGLIKTEYETDSYIVADANVLDYGAMGNGRTDDTKAFQAAINAVNAMGGGTVFVPAGYYCLTETLSLPDGVGLVGELEKGTARGTVLCIYGGKGKTDPALAAVLMSHQSAVMNIAFWYPEQTFVNGAPIPYPPTLAQNGSESVTIRNVTFVNAYFGIHFGKNGNNSLQYVRDVYGTCLDVGYYNDKSYDIGRVENILFTPDIWLSSGLPGTPNAALLRTYMIRHSIGLHLQRIDWTYLADITVEGYSIGLLCDESENGTSNGHIYRVHFLDCYYGMYADKLSWMMATNCVWKSVGGEGATPLYVRENCGGKISLSFCTLSTSGANAVTNWGMTEIALMDCTLDSQSESVYLNLRNRPQTVINTTEQATTQPGYGPATSFPGLEIDTPALPTDVDYGKTVETKPASDAFIHMGQEPYNIKTGEDITERLQNAIDSLKDTGGTVYLPAGQYRLNGYIDVWAGIELRGAVAWPQNMNKTAFLTDVGRNDPDGRALFTLYDGAGMRGLSVIYDYQDHNALTPYAYSIRGNGRGIYLVGVSLPTSWRGVDFASYRCDEHYIEYLWMAPLDTGIHVGAGSENGIIRDCHFTPNTWCLRTGDNWWNNVYKTIMERSRPYVIGESKNQILYHNFTYGAREGLSVLDGAYDVYLLCHGVDSGYTSAYFSGDCTVTMVDSQLVNLYQNNSGADLHYLETAEDFTGRLTMIQSAYWGSTKGAFILRGEGDVVMYGVQMHSAGVPLCRLDGGSLSLYGMLETSRTEDFHIGEGALSLDISGNVFPGGLQIKKDDNATADITGSDVEE